MHKQNGVQKFIFHLTLYFLLNILVCAMLSTKYDLEMANKFVRVLEKAVISEAFIGHTSQLIHMKVRFT